MSEHTEIEWADHTFNPWVGCSKVGPACAGCYAETWAKRSGHPELWNGERRRTTATNWQQPVNWDRAAATAGVCERVFPSLCDPFDNQVPQRWRDDFWHLIEQTPHLDWLLLTKRPGNIAKMLPNPATGVKPWGDGWPNVWLGVSAGNQKDADRDIPILLKTPAAIRFVSLEPLLGPVDLTRIKLKGVVDPFDALTGATWSRPPSLNGARFFSSNIARENRAKLDLVIVGGETGPRARPIHPAWLRSLRDQCIDAEVSFFFKRWGGWALAPWKLERLSGESLDAYKSRSDALAATHGFAEWGHLKQLDHAPWSIERAPEAPPYYAGMRRVRKGAGDRELDGRIWNQMPGVKPSQRQTGNNPAANRSHQHNAIEVTP